MVTRSRFVRRDFLGGGSNDAGMRLKVREQVGHILRRGGLQLSFDRFAHAASTRRFKCFLQCSKRQFSGVIGVRDERAFAGNRINPARGNGDYFVVKSRCARAVEGNTTEEGDAANGVIGLADTGAGEIVVYEALRPKTTEQALNDAVFKVKMNHILIYVGGGLEDNRADGARCPPLVEILIISLRGAKRVHRAEPCAAMNLGELPAVRAALQRRAVVQFQGGGYCVDEIRRVEADIILGFFEVIVQRLQFTRKFRLAFADRFEFLLNGFAAGSIGVEHFELGGERWFEAFRKEVFDAPF